VTVIAIEFQAGAELGMPSGVSRRERDADQDRSEFAGQALESLDRKSLGGRGPSEYRLGRASMLIRSPT
jgi:hypothetical protein